MKKKRNKKEAWVCPEDCKDWKTIPCKHLESELNQGTRSNSVATRHVGDIDQFSNIKYEKVDFGSEAADLDSFDPFNVIIPPHIQNRTYEKAFRKKLKNLRLAPIYIDVIVFKFIYEMTLVEIKDELGLASAQTVHNILKRGLADARKRGFGK